jgi:SAM-dependent methyltransferase
MSTRKAVLTAWLRAARLRERSRAKRRGSQDLWAHRRELIRQLAPGRSFIDIGGMWSVHGDVAFWAEEAGATDVVLCDGMDPTEEFSAKHAERDSNVRYVQRDLHDTEGIEALGRFDVVWCSGVIYHTPNPYLQLENLRRITNEKLVLGTHVIPEIPGFEGACLWYPGWSEESRNALGGAHGKRGDLLLGASTPFDYSEALGYANFWWGITPSALHSMLDVARFRVVDSFQPHWWILDVVADPIDRPSVIPDPDFARRRDEARHAGQL